MWLIYSIIAVLLLAAELLYFKIADKCNIIPIGQWHTVRSLESGTVILEVKDGPYEPLSDVDILV